MRRQTIMVAALAAVACFTVAPAQAAPAEPIAVSCDGSDLATVLVNGNGPFTPGRDADGTRVLVPLSFQDFEFTLQLPGEDPVSEPVEDGDLKGNGAAAKNTQRELITCSFSDEFVVPEGDPELPAGTVLTFSGTVTGFFTGRP